MVNNENSSIFWQLAPIQDDNLNKKIIWRASAQVKKFSELFKSWRNGRRKLNCFLANEWHGAIGTHKFETSFAQNNFFPLLSRKILYSSYRPGLELIVKKIERFFIIYNRVIQKISIRTSTKEGNVFCSLFKSDV